MEITDEALSSYKNQGGYDMLGRTRDQIRTTEQVKAAMATCQALKLDALVIIGGIVCCVCLLSFIYYLDQIQAHNVFLCSLKVSHPTLMLLSLLRHLLSSNVQQRLDDIFFEFFSSLIISNSFDM